jgi:hypothetical protein
VVGDGLGSPAGLALLAPRGALEGAGWSPAAACPQASGVSAAINAT